MDVDKACGLIRRTIASIIPLNLLRPLLAAAVDIASILYMSMWGL
jgi:hypothetical protein